MTTATAITGKTESVLKRMSVNAVNIGAGQSGTRTTTQLNKSQMGGYFANMDKLAYQVLMIWNGTDQPQDRQELIHHLLIHHIAPQSWFCEQDYINAPDYRHQIDTMVEIALHNLTNAKQLTKKSQRERLKTTDHHFRYKWNDRIQNLEAYLHQLLNQAAQQVSKNI